MGGARIKPVQTCIIGYGNRYRRDDGIGPFVAERLRETVSGGIRVLVLHQLDPVVVEEVRDRDLAVFVDATEEKLGGGTQWKRVQPEGWGSAYTTHLFKPSRLLGLLYSLYGKVPETWLVSVQGEDFGHGTELTEEAQGRAVRATREIADFISAKTG